jgi:acylphosphatase
MIKSFPLSIRATSRRHITGTAYGGNPPRLTTLALLGIRTEALLSWLSISSLMRAVITVSGKVQGVGYRALAFETAQRMGITGYVRNLTDGTVRIVAEADEETLREFIDALWALPDPVIHVRALDVEWCKDTGEYSNFRISVGLR